LIDARSSLVAGVGSQARCRSVLAVFGGFQVKIGWDGAEAAGNFPQRRRKKRSARQQLWRVELLPSAAQGFE
jgi:hypothetical protein